MGLGELMKHLCSLMFYFSRFKETFSLKLSVTYINFIKHTFVNTDETFAFSPYLIPSIIRKSLSILPQQ